MNFLKKLFCQHPYTAIDTFYQTDYDYGTLWYPHTYIIVYRVLKCFKCDKEIHQKILVKEFTGWNDNRNYQRWLQSEGILPYDEYVLKTNKEVEYNV